MALATGRDVKTMMSMAKPSAKILVVDDDDEIRSLLLVVLSREGFDVQQAKDAEQRAIFSQRETSWT